MMEENAPVPVQAVITYHPGCRKVRPWQVKIPVLMLTGALNDFYPPAHCQALRAQLPADTPVTLRVFPEARHGFDYRGLPPVLKYGKGTMGYHPEATAAAWKEVQQFLQR